MTKLVYAGSEVAEWYKFLLLCEVWSVKGEEERKRWQESGRNTFLRITRLSGVIIHGTSMTTEGVSNPHPYENQSKVNSEIWLSCIQGFGGET